MFDLLAIWCASAVLFAAGWSRLRRKQKRHEAMAKRMRHRLRRNLNI